jgi:hypothetical protein
MMCVVEPCACGGEEECGCIPSALVGPEGLHYCTECAATVLRFCFACGCTEVNACAGGCSWVEGSEICSACLEAQGAMLEANGVRP